jgi:hypothetical protein
LIAYWKKGGLLLSNFRREKVKVSLENFYKDGKCKGCKDSGRLFQPADFLGGNPKGKGRNWYCRKCLNRKFGIKRLISLSGKNLEEVVE